MTTLYHDADTLRFYAEEAPAYSGSGPSGASRHLANFLGGLPPGAHVLELGCGGGRDAQAMIVRGFEVDATDGSAALAAEAAQRLGQPVRTMRFDELNADEAYDAVWAAACLLHLPRAGLPRILSRVRRALKSNGLHFASYKAAGEEGRDRFGRLFNHPSAADLRAMYNEAGDWEFVAVEEYIGGGYDGQQGP